MDSPRESRRISLQWFCMITCKSRGTATGVAVSVSTRVLNSFNLDVYNLFCFNSFKYKFRHHGRVSSPLDPCPSPNLIPRGRDPFGQRRGSRPLAYLWPDGILSPQITDFRLHRAESKVNSSKTSEERSVQIHFWKAWNMHQQKLEKQILHSNRNKKRSWK